MSMATNKDLLIWYKEIQRYCLEEVMVRSKQSWKTSKSYLGKCNGGQGFFQCMQKPQRQEKLWLQVFSEARAPPVFTKDRGRLLFLDMSTNQFLRWTENYYPSLSIFAYHHREILLENLKRRSSLADQQAKDPALSLLWLRFNPWTENVLMQWMWQKIKKKKI